MLRVGFCDEAADLTPDVWQRGKLGQVFAPGIEGMVFEPWLPHVIQDKDGIGAATHQFNGGAQLPAGVPPG